MLDRVGKRPGRRKLKRNQDRTPLLRKVAETEGIQTRGQMEGGYLRTLPPSQPAGLTHLLLIPAGSHTSADL